MHPRYLILPIKNDPHTFWVGDTRTLDIPLVGSYADCVAFVAKGEEQERWRAALLASCRDYMEESAQIISQPDGGGSCSTLQTNLLEN